MNRFALLVAELPLAVFLLFDSLFVNGFARADPATGREQGCYTTIETIIGAKREGQIRSAEVIVGLVLIPVTAILLLVIGRAARKRA